MTNEAENYSPGSFRAVYSCESVSWASEILKQEGYTIVRWQRACWDKPGYYCKFQEKVASPHTYFYRENGMEVGHYSHTFKKLFIYERERRVWSECG